jgi:hypothetical protein
MKFALVNGSRQEASPKLRGICIGCQSEMIAKCGKYKVWHWAHKSKEICDKWWETETEWHRKWKNYFPESLQEVIQFDSTGEMHIADVRTKNNMVIELQHSPIHPEEMASREQFYKRMIWIVDGNRSDLDKSYFNLSIQEKVSDKPLIYNLRWWGKSKLLEKWGNAQCPVFLDFGDDILWWLLEYNSKEKTGKVRVVPKEELITKNGGQYAT